MQCLWRFYKIEHGLCKNTFVFLTLYISYLFTINTNAIIKRMFSLKMSRDKQINSVFPKELKNNTRLKITQDIILH